MKHSFKIIILSFFTCTFAVASEPTTLRFRSYNRILDQKSVTLLDLIDKDSLNSEQVDMLSQIQLGDAPKLGEQRVYSSNVIAEALRKNVSSKQVNIQIPHRVTVQNRGYELDEPSVRAELLAQWQKFCSDCRIQITSMKMPTLPSSLQSRPWRYDRVTQLPRGNFSQKIIVTTVDNQDQYFWINGEIEVSKRVPVLIRSTPIQTRLQPDDFKFEWRDITRATDTTPNETEIVGQQARFTMNANDIIWRNSLVREKAVQRGEIVKVTIGDEKWQISTQALTQQDGFVGDTISLKNLQTQKIITGRVTGIGEVEIR